MITKKEKKYRQDDTKLGGGIRDDDSVLKCHVLQANGCLYNVFRPNPQTDECNEIVSLSRTIRRPLDGKGRPHSFGRGSDG
jgi:hypothetical protein